MLIIGTHGQMIGLVTAFIYDWFFILPYIWEAEFPAIIFRAGYYALLLLQLYGVFMGVVALGMIHIRLFFINSTTIEDRGKNRQFYTQFNIGYMHNLRFFFGNFWILLYPRERTHKYEGFDFDSKIVDPENKGPDVEIVSEGELKLKCINEAIYSLENIQFK